LLYTGGRCASAVRRGSAKKSCLFNLEMLDEKRYSNEEDEGCAALKLILINQISRLRSEGCTRFAVSMDCGVGLYAAEILHGLKGSDDDLETICYVPYEEQATRWTAALRDRYFNAYEIIITFSEIMLN